MLYSLFANMLSGKQKMICAFIDFRKAFDTISHTHLWSKLLKYGVGNRFLIMYRQVRNCIRLFSDLELSKENVYRLYYLFCL